MRVVRLGGFRKPIGKQGEHGVTRVEIDASELLREFPNGTPEALYKRSDGLCYPVPCAMDGNICYFIVEENESHIVGNVEIEIDWYVGGNLAKSLTYAAKIVESVGEPSDPPDVPGESWVEQIAGMVQEIDEKLDEAVPEGGDEGQVLTKHDGANVWSDPQGGGTGDHRELTNRDADNQHPINAITGLRAELDGKQATVDDLETIRSGAASGATAYQKPLSGIPKTDLASDVKTSLGLADTALQSFTETDPTVPAWAKASSKPTYTATEVGAATQEDIDTAADNLQEQIDALVSRSDVVDVVGTYAELQAYDTSTLGNNDVVKVLSDSTHDNARTYYRWGISGSSGSWTYVGSESVGYTKSETDTLLNAKQDAISDLETIRSGAAAGATAVQPSALNSYATQTYVDQQIASAISGAIGGEY